jgi:hypothetical protein
MLAVAAVLVVTALSLALAPQLSGEAGGADADRPSGTLLFLSRGNELTSIDVESGRRVVRRVPGVAGCAPEVQLSGDRVVFAGVRRRRTTVFSVPVTLDRPPKLLGAAHAFVPSATDGRVWLAGTDCDQSKMVGVREVTVDGRVTMTSHRRVPGRWLDGAVEGGLVVAERRTLVVWDPRMGRKVDRLALDALLDTRGPLLAGCARHSDCRRLVILNRRTGRTTVALPDGPYRLDSAAKLSPDGLLLAAPAVAKRRWRVALVDTADGATTIVPGSATGRAYPDLKWSPSSGWLFFRARDRLRAYRPGAARVVTLPIRPPRNAVAFVAG